jgi:hypothetical protein
VKRRRWKGREKRARCPGWRWSIQRNVLDRAMKSASRAVSGLTRRAPRVGHVRQRTPPYGSHRDQAIRSPRHERRGTGAEVGGEPRLRRGQAAQEICGVRRRRKATDHFTHSSRFRPREARRDLRSLLSPKSCARSLPWRAIGLLDSVARRPASFAIGRPRATVPGTVPSTVPGTVRSPDGRARSTTSSHMRTVRPPPVARCRQGRPRCCPN